MRPVPLQMEAEVGCHTPLPEFLGITTVAVHSNQLLIMHRSSH